MRIVYIVPGFGDAFYCENCLRDSELGKKLQAQGHEVIMVPMYLPLSRGHEHYNEDIPIFYGAINVYLKQKIPFFKKFPKWIERMFNARGLLNWAAKKSGSTDAKGLEGMTLSVLQGTHGKQVQELEMLINWLRSDGKPDLVHISNALLLGLAPAIKKELDIPVYCSLQDEDIWIKTMDPIFAEKIWRVMEEQSVYVDGFFAVSGFYKEVMQKNMNLPPEKVHVVYLGTDLDGFRESELPLDPPVIGYLSRFTDCLGLDILVDAFILLKKENRFPGLKLRATGGATGSDKKFIKNIVRKLKKKWILPGY